MLFVLYGLFFSPVVILFAYVFVNSFAEAIVTTIQDILGDKNEF